MIDIKNRGTLTEVLGFMCVLQHDAINGEIIWCRNIKDDAGAGCRQLSAGGAIWCKTIQHGALLCTYIKHHIVAARQLSAGGAA